MRLYANTRRRSQDGLTLYAVSSDGTMAVFSFDSNEMDGIAPSSAQEQYLKRFGFVAPPLPDGYSHLAAAASAKAQQTNHITPPPSPRAQSQDFGGTANAEPGGEQVHTLVAKRKPKKRIQPTFAGSLSGQVPSSSANGIKPVSSARAFQESSTIQISVPSTSALPLSVSQPFGLGLSTGESDFAMDVDGEVRISSLDTGAQNGRGKRKAGEDFDERMTGKARTLGGDRVRETVVIKPISSRAAPVVGVMWAEGSGLVGRLEPPQLVTYLKATIEGSEDVFEARNSEGDGMWAIVGAW